MAKAKSGVPAGHHTVTPHLIMNDAASALTGTQRRSAPKNCRGRRARRQDHARRDPRRQFDHHAQRRDGRRQEREGAGRFADLAVALCRRLRCVVQARRRGGRQGPARSDGRARGPVLGRSLRLDHRSGGLRLDDRDPQGRLDSGGTGSARAGVLQELRGSAERRPSPAPPGCCRRGRRSALLQRRSSGKPTAFFRSSKSIAAGGRSDRARLASAARIAWIETFSSVSG